MRNPPGASCSDEEFIKLFTTIGPTKLAKKFDISVRGVFKRRDRLEQYYKNVLHTPNLSRERRVHAVEHPPRYQIEVNDGVVLVGADAHIWPGPKSTAMRAFIKFCKGVDGERPKAVIMNGDVLDFPQISRHLPIGWETLPTVENEIESAQDILSEIEKATFKAEKIWCLGNHDGRFETRLANLAPEYAKVHGVHLRDHFPNWTPCWSTWINDDTVIKHRFKGGIHAVYNNTVQSGTHIVTGHLHSAKVTPFTDYNGTRYGVDTGCLAETFARAFTDYMEENPRNWRSAFCVLTYYKGKLLIPELVLTLDEEHVQFRGKVISV